MAKGKKGGKRNLSPSTTSSTSSATPTIHKANRRDNGSIAKAGGPIDESEAVDCRKVGIDVVVCGDDHDKNKWKARDIEAAANSPYKRCGMHRKVHNLGLPHYQPDPRPPEGHTFYETDSRKAF